MSKRTYSIAWQGAIEALHSLALVNRAICARLARCGHRVTLVPPPGVVGRIGNPSYLAGRIGNPSYVAGRIGNPSYVAGRIGNPSYVAGRIGNPSYDAAV